MIRAPWDGVAFSERSDGDLRGDMGARDRASSTLGIPKGWAEVRQVHSNEVVRVEAPGPFGAADALWTTEPRLPVAIFTADCLGVVLAGPEAVGIAHAGWRGAAADVVGRLRDTMSSSGHPPDRAAVGPGIGPCCFEVGPEVADQFPGQRAVTTWGTPSVDLPAAVRAALTGLDLWSTRACTSHEEGWFSHRTDATTKRLAAIGWLQ
jgi:polyphenol oxidase